MSIKEKQLIYHLTSLDNLGGILDSGLLPRSTLIDFHDVADAEILTGRQAQKLEDYVPFHWFARNPFDGRVQADRSAEKFVLISVRRSLALGRNWKVIPRHPLHNARPELLDYQEGFEAIDWAIMDKRDYHDDECKSVCMAECLSPEPVAVTDFFMIYVRDDDVNQIVLGELRERGKQVNITINPHMFL